MQIGAIVEMKTEVTEYQKQILRSLVSLLIRVICPLCFARNIFDEIGDSTNISQSCYS